MNISENYFQIKITTDNFFQNISSMINNLYDSQKINNIDVNNDHEVRIELEVNDENNIEDLYENNYFRSCNHIKEVLKNCDHIKKDDKIIGTKCLICMEDYKHKEYKRVLPNCKHYFHKRCIDKWLKQNSSCPICRNQLL